MNNLTTIAALPSGPGCASKLPPEVGESREVSMEEHLIWGSPLIKHPFAWVFCIDVCDPIDLGPIGGEG